MLRTEPHPLVQRRRSRPRDAQPEPFEPTAPADHPAELLRIESLSFQYSSNTLDSGWSLQVPNLILHKKTIYSLHGDNMAGKTTLIKLLSGLLSPTKGSLELWFSGQRFSLPNQRHRLYRHGLRVVHQNDPLFPELPIWDNVRLGFYGRRIPRKDLDRAQDLCKKTLDELLSIGGNHPTSARLEEQDRTPLNSPLKYLSGGGIALFRLLRSLAWRCRLLLLDEVTANLDHHRKLLFFSLLEDHLPVEGALLLVSHDTEDHESISQLARRRDFAYAQLSLEAGLLRTEDG